MMLSSDIGSTEPSQAKFSKALSSYKQRRMYKQKPRFDDATFQQFYTKTKVNKSNPPTKLNSTELSKVKLKQGKKSQAFNQIQTSNQIKRKESGVSQLSSTHYSKQNTLALNNQYLQPQPQPNLVDILGPSLPPPGSFGSFAGKAADMLAQQYQSKNINFDNRIGTAASSSQKRPFTMSGGQRSFTVSNKRIIKNHKLTQSRLLRLCSPKSHFSKLNHYDQQLGIDNQKNRSFLNPRQYRIQRQNYILNQRFDKSTNLSDVTNLQGQIKLKRAKNMAKKTIERAGQKQQKQQKPILSMMQSKLNLHLINQPIETNNYTDSLYEMSTKFNRTQIGQSNVPYKAFFNQTVDQIKSSQLTAKQKTIQSFIILTPHKSQIKQHIDLMTQGNQKRIRVSSLDQKVISQ